MDLVTNINFKVNKNVVNSQRPADFQSGGSTPFRVSCQLGNSNELKPRFWASSFTSFFNSFVFRVSSNSNDTSSIRNEWPHIASPSLIKKMCFYSKHYYSYTKNLWKETIKKTYTQLQHLYTDLCSACIRWDCFIMSNDTIIKQLYFMRAPQFLIYYVRKSIWT